MKAAESVAILAQAIVVEPADVYILLETSRCRNGLILKRESHLCTVAPRSLVRKLEQATTFPQPEALQACQASQQPTRMKKSASGVCGSKFVMEFIGAGMAMGSSAAHALTSWCTTTTRSQLAADSEAGTSATNVSVTLTICWIMIREWHRARGMQSGGGCRHGLAILKRQK